MNDNVYYVISQPYCQVGLFALWKHVASHIMYAHEKGYIPVVDLQHLRNQFFKDGREWHDNAWEYFFEQPDGIGLEKLRSESFFSEKWKFQIRKT